MTTLVKTVEAVRAAIHEAKAAGRIVGLVPTMGALHKGHLHLVEHCRAEAGFVVVSIFVNPTQFGPGEDYTRYPRVLETDRGLCEAAGGDQIGAPAVDARYPRACARR